MNGGTSWRDIKTSFVPVNMFIIAVKWDFLTWQLTHFWSLKWPFEELRFWRFTFVLNSQPWRLLLSWMKRRWWQVRQWISESADNQQSARAASCTKFKWVELWLARFVELSNVRNAVRDIPHPLQTVSTNFLKPIIKHSQPFCKASSADTRKQAVSLISK